MLVSKVFHEWKYNFKDGNLRGKEDGIEITDANYIMDFFHVNI